MKTQAIVNGSITLVLEPENPMEEEILKALAKQSCELYEVRGPVTVLGKTIKGSLLVCAKESFREGSEPANTN